MPSKAEKNRAETRWLMALNRQAGRGYLLALLAPVISGGLLVVQAFALASVLERAIVGGVAPATHLPGIALIVGLILVRTILGALGDRSGIVAAERIKLNLRTTLFGSILAKPPSWSDGRSSGALSSVMVEQVEAVDGFFSRYYPAMVQASVLPIAFAAIILPLDWLAALLFLVTAPLIPVFMALVGWGAQAATEHQATALSRLSGRFADRLRGLTTLKLFGRATSETEAVYEASENLRERALKHREEIRKQVLDRDRLRLHAHPLRRDHRRQTFHDGPDHFKGNAAGADDDRGAKLNDLRSRFTKQTPDFLPARQVRGKFFSFAKTA